jgi:hypothetical protein
VTFRSGVPRNPKLADVVMTRPVVDVRLSAEKFGVTTVNAQLAIDGLVEDEVIEQIGRGVRKREEGGA